MAGHKAWVHSHLAWYGTLVPRWTLVLC